jgi:type II secretory pathway component GspD/PulD (secretin)
MFDFFEQPYTLIGGLKITEQVESRSSAPLLSKIPVIGKAFRSRSTIKDHKMLLILVKPIINPQQKAKKILRGETDSEELIKSLARQLEKSSNVLPNKDEKTKSK